MDGREHYDARFVDIGDERYKPSCLNDVSANMTHSISNSRVHYAKIEASRAPPNTKNGVLEKSE